MKRRKMKHVLIVGCGDVARRLLPWLRRRFRVTALMRREDESDSLRALGVSSVLGDLDRPATLYRLAGIADYVLYCAPPPNVGDDDPRMRRLLAALARRGSLPRRLLYISTTGIYGDCAGEWVTESRPPRPDSPRGQRRLAAERHLRRWGRQGACCVGILRAPGIYDGAARLPTARLERGDPVLCRADDVFTNHIHADDLARVLGLALYRAKPNRAYNVCDDGQLRMGDYFDLVADTLGLPRPPRLTREEIGARLSPLTLSFMAESRRLHNTRLKNELRVRLRYPTVAAALARRAEN